MAHAQTPTSTQHLLWYDDEIYYQQTEKSAAVLLALENVDGVLVGGASLRLAEFMQIAAAGKIY